jgi:hypothetical protein
MLHRIVRHFKASERNRQDCPQGSAASGPSCLARTMAGMALGVVHDMGQREGAAAPHSPDS